MSQTVFELRFSGNCHLGSSKTDLEKLRYRSPDPQTGRLTENVFFFFLSVSLHSSSLPMPDVAVEEDKRPPSSNPPAGYERILLLAIR